MTNHTNTPTEASLALAQRYISLWSSHDAESLRQLLSEDIDITFPMPPSGSPDPWALYDGIEQAMGYLTGAMANLPQLRFVEQQWSVSDDARFVHLHALGDMIARTGADYTNRYVFRFEIEDGLVAHVLEYANPVTYAALNL